MMCVKRIHFINFFLIWSKLIGIWCKFWCKFGGQFHGSFSGFHFRLYCLFSRYFYEVVNTKSGI